MPDLLGPVELPVLVRQGDDHLLEPLRPALVDVGRPQLRESRRDVRLHLGIGVDRRPAAEERVVRKSSILDRAAGLGPVSVVPFLVPPLHARTDLEGETEWLHEPLLVGIGTGIVCLLVSGDQQGGAMQTTSETRIGYFAPLGRRTRLGSWQDQKISTYRKIREAIGESRWDDAAELANYFVDEAKVCFAIYRQWIPDLTGFLAENGVPREDLDSVNKEIVANLDLPDGRPWDPFRQWHGFVTEIEELVALIHREQAEAALEKLDEAKETWR